MIRVAYPMRVDALDKSGGDVLLMRKYIRCCTQLADLRGFRFEGVIMPELEPELSSFDLVHLTNIDRPVDIYRQFKTARAARKPIVLSPLHHSYDEIRKYERGGRNGSIGLVSGLIGFNSLEITRTLIRSRKYPPLRSALIPILGKGVRAAQAEVLRGSDMVLVAADKERGDIEREICIPSPESVLCVRNGFTAPATRPSLPFDRDVDVCVAGRIEARKNQIAILEALESLGVSGVFVGPENPNHKIYCSKFRAMISRSRSTYLGGRTQEEVYGIMARSRVHIAASWFEVSSNVDVESYVLGCRTVASGSGGTKELLGDDAYYVDPACPDSIHEQVFAALDSSRKGITNSIDLRNGMLRTWEQVCETVLGVYTTLCPSGAAQSSMARAS